MTVQNVKKLAVIDGKTLMDARLPIKKRNLRVGTQRRQSGRTDSILRNNLRINIKQNTKNIAKTNSFHHLPLLLSDTHLSKSVPMQKKPLFFKVFRTFFLPAIDNAHPFIADIQYPHSHENF